jgi:hypothetical protein
MALAKQKRKSKRIRKVAAASKPKKKRKSWLGKYRGIDFVQKLRRKKLGIKPKEKAGRVGAQAKKAVKTKGGTYVKYKKKSASAKSFRSTFASSCKGKGAGDVFSWQGRSYSCRRADEKKKVVAKDSPKKQILKDVPKKKSKKKIIRKTVRRKTVNVSAKVPKKIMKDLKARAAAKKAAFIGPIKPKAKKKMPPKKVNARAAYKQVKAWNQSQKKKSKKKKTLVSAEARKDYRTTNYKKDRDAAIASIKARRKKAKV